jgi:Zn-dependent protease
VQWNLMMGLFNLVPVFPMDGGRILRAALASRLPYLRATFIAATLGKVLAFLAALAAVLFFDSLLMALLFVFIYFAGEMEYRAVQRREWEDARWRTMVARAYATDVPPAEEPPLLSR